MKAASLGKVGLSGQGGKMKQTGVNLSLSLLLVGVGNTLTTFAVQCTESQKSKFSYFIDHRSDEILNLKSNCHFKQ